MALWSRLSGFRGQQLHEAARNGEIVRGTWLRATIHLVSADDYVAFRTRLQPVIDRELTATRWRSIGDGFDEARAEQLARALLERAPMSAQALGEALQVHFPKADRSALGHWVRTRVPLAMVPGDERWGWSRPPRFVPADRWLQRPLEMSDLDTLLLQGIAAIGPVTAGDLRMWSGLPGIAARLEALRPRLKVFLLEDGRELFDLPDAPRPRADTPAPVRFLPEFDNVLLSHEDRSRIVPAAHARRFNQTANGRRPRAVLVDGFARAGWTWTRERNQATLQLQPYERFDAATRDALEAEALALLHFLEPDAATHRVRTHAISGART
ncbi:winged helix DNA-binding domain-containing protein [Lysobacter stagni]|uniref:winged helix DNA-binding domain-containing protein n=1 Tax=Lysobacter stagni TaxID=3045172 RepID=UPI003D78936A